MLNSTTPLADPTRVREYFLTHSFDMNKLAWKTRTDNRMVTVYRDGQPIGKLFSMADHLIYLTYIEVEAS